MQAFSIRQLKSNPPHCDQDHGVPNTAAVLSGLALSLFRAGSISVASAALLPRDPLLPEDPCGGG